MKTLILSSIPILIAIIAWFAALYQVKSNIISNARINWTNNLRDLVSEYIVTSKTTVLLVNNIKNKVLNLGEDHINKIIENNYSIYLNESNKTEIIGNKILLLLNPKYPDHKIIINSINEVYKYLEFEDINNLDKNIIEPFLQDIIEASQRIIDNEWQKSKTLFKI
ncbi:MULTISPECIES: hypothetical protein [unclassified Empedobacter]|uniref:hypothetical protein n=1 Tax=unclassified Empedobacter TaxID=2643773 RepID=UPI0025B9F961|nr:MULTISPECIES: hypothetical protein [unclassified Empedobacter]